MSSLAWLLGLGFCLDPLLWSGYGHVRGHNRAGHDVCFAAKTGSPCHMSLGADHLLPVGASIRVEEHGRLEPGMARRRHSCVVGVVEVVGRRDDAMYRHMRERSGKVSAYDLEPEDEGGGRHKSMECV